MKTQYSCRQQVTSLLSRPGRYEWGTWIDDDLRDDVLSAINLVRLRGSPELWPALWSLVGGERPSVSILGEPDLEILQLPYFRAPPPLDSAGVGVGGEGSSSSLHSRSVGCCRRTAHQPARARAGCGAGGVGAGLGPAAAPLHGRRPAGRARRGGGTAVPDGVARVSQAAAGLHPVPRPAPIRVSPLPPFLPRSLAPSLARSLARSLALPLPLPLPLPLSLRYKSCKPPMVFWHLSINRNI